MKRRRERLSSDLHIKIRSSDKSFNSGHAHNEVSYGRGGGGGVVSSFTTSSEDKN